MMRLSLLVVPALAGTCCWSKWGDAADCGNYPSGGSGGICGDDPSKPCSSGTDCGTSPPPSPAPSPPAPAPPAPAPAGCGSCTAPDNCYHATWLVTCSTSLDQASCEASSGGEWCNSGPAPPSPPTPTPPPTPPSPTPTPAPTPQGTVIGYWDWTWSSSRAPAGATFGVAFNGWAEPSRALADSEGVYNSLVGRKYLSIGGGNENGAFSKTRLASLVSMINAGQLSKYQGLALDVEECSETGLAPSFLAATAAAKAKGMETMVTISHSAPYGCSDARDLMLAFFADAHCDYLSPQLYTSGAEAAPDFTETAVGSVTWEEYLQSKARIIPSIVDGTHYAATQSYFAGKGIALSGYVQWAHATSEMTV